MALLWDTILPRALAATAVASLELMVANGRKLLQAKASIMDLEAISRKWGKSSFHMHDACCLLQQTWWTSARFARLGDF